MKKRALLLVYHKKNLEYFAKGLIELGYSLVSSGDTAKYLKEWGFEVTDHEDDLRQHRIDRFHLVCVDLYPVAKAIAKKDATVESVMEMTDIDGPTLLRGAAKNYKNIIVVCDPEDRQMVLDQMIKLGGISPTVRFLLARKVFETMAEYDRAICKFLYSPPI